MVLDEKRVPFVSNVCWTFSRRGWDYRDTYRKGRVSSATDDVRDKAVYPDHCETTLCHGQSNTERIGTMQTVDNSVKKVPVVKVHIDTPCLSGEVEALCLFAI